MNPNTHTLRPSDGVAALTMAVDSLATQNLDGLSDAVADLREMAELDSQAVERATDGG